MQIIDGKKIRDEILKGIKVEVSKLSFVPVFCDVLVGDDPASIQYVEMKKKMAEMVGIHFHTANFKANITNEKLVKEIQMLNVVKNMCGIIVQLPLPKSIDQQTILNSINPKLDVDCLSALVSENFYKSYDGSIDLGYPTALACMAILDSLNLDLTVKNMVVLGQGMLVGKPVAALLKSRGLEPVVIRSKTEGKEELIKEADIIISGMGKGKYIKGDMIKKGAVLIDAGTSESMEPSTEGEMSNSIVGDVDLNSVKDVASYVSPVPGGVGPVTVAILLKNVLQVAKNIN